MTWRGIDAWLADHGLTYDTAAPTERELVLDRLKADPPRGLPGAEHSDTPAAIGKRAARRRRRTVSA